MALTRPRAHQLSDVTAKKAVRVVAAANITLAGSAPATVDGVSLTLDDRILVTAQSSGAENGIYRVTSVGSGSNGTWVRARDSNQAGEITAGMTCMVSEGSTYADTFWKLTTDGAITIGSTALTFEQHSGGGGSPGGSDTQVQFNDGDSFGADAGLTYNKTTDALTVAGAVTGGTLTDGTATLTSGALTGATNITGSGTITGGTVTAAGAGSTYLRATSSNAGSGSGLYTQNATNSYYIGAGAASGGSSLEFRDNTNSATRMVINSSGYVGIGTLSPTTPLEVTGTVAATSYTGDGSALTGVVADSASAGGVIYENSDDITSNYTLTTGKNGMSVGPITIASGVTVTVPSGQRWVIL